MTGETHSEPQESNSPDKDLRGGFSLDRRVPQPPLPSQQSNRLFWWCRLIIWLSPGSALIFIMAGLSAAGYASILFVIPATWLFAFGAGCCDAFLSPSVSKHNGKPETKEMLWHALAFSSLQIVIAPLTLVMIGMLIVFALDFV